MQPKAKFNACHFLQCHRFTNSVSSFVVMTYVGDGPFFGQKVNKHQLTIHNSPQRSGEMTHIT